MGRSQSTYFHGSSARVTQHSDKGPQLLPRDTYEDEISISKSWCLLLKGFFIIMAEQLVPMMQLQVQILQMITDIYQTAQSCARRMDKLEEDLKVVMVKVDNATTTVDGLRSKIVELETGKAEVKCFQQALAWNETYRALNHRKSNFDTINGLRDVRTGVAIPGFPATFTAIDSLDEASVDRILLALGSPTLSWGTWSAGDVVAEKRRMVGYFAGRRSTV